MTELVVEEVEPTLEELEFLAAKQLAVELAMLRNRIYKSNTLMNSVLIVQIKQILRGFIRKYNEFGFFKGETLQLDLRGRRRDKFANFSFTASTRLKLLLDQARKPEEVQPK